MRALLLGLAFAALPASADVFRCVTPEGKTLYSDAPCPRGSHSSNITSSVGECTTDECLAERERVSAAARERLKAEKEALAAMTAERRKAEADALAERVKLAELHRLTAIDERLAAEMQAAAQSDLTYPVYPYPWYPVLPCKGPCGVQLPGHRFPSMHPKRDHRREPSVSFRDFERRPR
jgi:hypothetical protein